MKFRRERYLPEVNFSRNTPVRGFFSFTLIKPTRACDLNGLNRRKSYRSIGDSQSVRKTKKMSTYVSDRSFEKIGGRTVKCRYGRHIDRLGRRKRRGPKSKHAVQLW